MRIIGSIYRKPVWTQWSECLYLKHSDSLKLTVTAFPKYFSCESLKHFKEDVKVM